MERSHLPTTVDLWRGTIWLQAHIAWHKLKVELISRIASSCPAHNRLHVAGSRLALVVGKLFDWRATMGAKFGQMEPEQEQDGVLVIHFIGGKTYIMG